MSSDDVDFQIVNAVNESWDVIKKIPNYDLVAGEILFRKIFEIAPPALNMFSFGPEFVGNEEALYASKKFKSHASGVVKMLDAAVHMLGPDLEPVTKALTKLGATHVAFGVLPVHYSVVGEALIHTLATALGAKWTPIVQKGWTLTFGFVATAMMAGATNHLQKRMRRKNRIAARTRAKMAKANGETKMVQEDHGEASLATFANGRNVSAVVLEVTGLQTTPTPKKMTELTDLIENVLIISTDDEDDDDDLTLSTRTGDCLEETEVHYGKMVKRVYTTWDKIKKIPNYQEVAGVLLFTNIFEIAPQAKGLFPQAETFGDDTEGLLKDEGFLKHARGVVIMLDLAVNMLGIDLEPVTEALEDLGARHCQYGVIEDHYPIVGEALLKTLEAALGDAWTPTVKEGWTWVYGFVSNSMQRGAANFIKEENDAAHEI